MVIQISKEINKFVDEAVWPVDLLLEFIILLSILLLCYLPNGIYKPFF